MPINAHGFYDTGYYATKNTSLSSGSYSHSALSQSSYSPTKSVPTNTQPIDTSTFLDAVRSLVSEMKSIPVRDLEYLDYLWRTELAKKQADKQAMFRAYGSE